MNNQKIEIQSSVEDFERVITNMSKNVNEYYRMKVMNGDDLNRLLKDISASLYYLETVRSDIHDQFQSRISELVEEGKSVARAENAAHVEIPAMYKLRRVMDGAYKVTEAIRSNISYLKHEITTSKAA